MAKAFDTYQPGDKPDLVSFKGAFRPLVPRVEPGSYAYFSDGQELAFDGKGLTFNVPGCGLALYMVQFTRATYDKTFETAQDTVTMFPFGSGVDFESMKVFGTGTCTANLTFDDETTKSVTVETGSFGADGSAFVFKEDGKKITKVRVRSLSFVGAKYYEVEE